MSIIYFIILIGGLIFIHEFGHFLVAKIFDVKVERFSIGFGPRLFAFERGETEYTICILPLGGYVKMLGFDYESLQTIPESEKDRALMAKPIWQRSLITLAGPGFNLIFPVLVYFFFTAGQATVSPSMVGEVLADTPAEKAGLKPGDRIVEIDDQPVKYWHQVTGIVSNRYSDSLELTVERGDKRKMLNVTPETKTSTDVLGLNRQKYGRLGILLTSYGTTIAPESPESPAARAGLDAFDKIIAVDGTFIDRFDKLHRLLQQKSGKSVELTYLDRSKVDLDFAQFFDQSLRQTSVTPTQTESSNWSIGVEPSEMYLSKIAEDSPAEKAGLRMGDKILSVDGQRYNNFSLINQQIRNELNKYLREKTKNGHTEALKADPLSVTYERNGKQKKTTITPQIHKYTGQGSQERYRIELGWKNLTDSVKPEEIYFPLVPRLGFAAEQSITQTVQIVDMMITGFVRMAQGQVGMDTVGGPIMIGELAAQAGEAGWAPFLQMMALISINLAVINLLPIPVLDGGHLMLYAIEAIKREPLSYRTRQIAAYIGLVLIILLMLLAFKNDIERNWEYIADAIRAL